MTKYRIENGVLRCPVAGQRQTNLYVDAGKIVAVGDSCDGFAEAVLVDARGKWIMPGIVDLSVSLREPGLKQKGSIESETYAAVKGGVTTVCCSPLSNPVNDSEAISHLIGEQARKAGYARVLPVGAMTSRGEGKQLSAYYALRSAGCIAVSHSRDCAIEPQVLRRCFQYARTHDLTVFMEPQETTLAQDGCVNEGVLSARLGLVGIPHLAETLMVSQSLLLAKETRVRLHLSQLSCAESVAMIRQAKANGVAVTADVTMHHLLLTENDVEPFDGRYHVLPPLRCESDREALIQAVSDGTLDAIVSQHAPHEQAAKQAPFGETEPGVSSIELLLPLLFRLVETTGLDLDTVLPLLTTKPAAIAGLTEYGLQAGAVADFVIVDPDKRWKVNASEMRSRGKNTLFSGVELPCSVEKTFVAGQNVYDCTL
ncbi:dihydroorotase [Oleiphilus messinensis]|uniref:Dihydroorotase n=1 Tax=Oleiphilus messinensis TaxID=141451 RepID=A0A1Y0I2E5_9GAMM|nr:dihydroorotase [Oleiphilus messinensis]ARU54430.1 dihydroorotase [Oleiphilus messinensis]